MQKGKVFLVDESANKLIPLEESGYVAESKLQEILAEYPDLLAGDQVDPDDPRRWLLIGREIPIPGDADEGGRWSLDHLFIDQDGIPTFVECKLAHDTRSRREVVAQMLDYAANGSEYLSMDRIRQYAAETAERRGHSLDDQILNLLGKPDDPQEIETLWNNVQSNLTNRKIRLIFVTDSTPRELRRLVEFLNEEMKTVVVLAVEIKQFQGTGPDAARALVPRVLGSTETARSTKVGKTKKRRTTPKEFFDQCAPDAKEFFQRVIDLAQARGHKVNWGEVGFSVRAPLGDGGRLASFVYGYPPETFQFYFQKESLLPRDKSSPLREELLSSGAFTESGEYTLNSYVSEVGVPRLNDVYDVILDRIGKFLKDLASKR